jgi:hypothetical protein
MALPIENIVNDMVASISGEVSSDVQVIKNYFLQILKEQKEALETIANGFKNGDLTEQEVMDELESEKKTMEAQLLAIEVMNKAMVQKAANAAMNFILKVLKIVVS